jgi:NAD(P)-dependent dehydrogenase (short-subunit alcohol dehydrogenase family)
MVSAGAKVFCHYYKSEKEAEALKNMVPDVQLIKGDLRQVSTTKSLIDEVVQISGTIDVLINNAAVFIKTPLGTVTEETWDTLFSLNLKAGFFLAQEASRIMVKNNGGKIINIADTSGYRPFPSFIPYALTKSGMISMTKGLAKALAPYVQVNGINPGPVLIPESYTDEERRKAVDKTLLKREGRAEDVAAAVRFLLEDGDYITGIVLAVDGGRSLN